MTARVTLTLSLRDIPLPQVGEGLWGEGSSSRFNMPYPHHIIGVARHLRKNATATEKLLWEQLRDRRLAGLKFARQHPFGRYVADFYCAELKLVIEIEGGVHNIPMQKEYDRLRIAELESRGLGVLRVQNEEVLHGMDKLLKGILDRRAKR